eukprot:2111010-Amphidinium_carterae.2
MLLNRKRSKVHRKAKGEYLLRYDSLHSVWLAGKQLLCCLKHVNTVWTYEVKRLLSKFWGTSFDSVTHVLRLSAPTCRANALASVEGVWSGLQTLVSYNSTTYNLLCILRGLREN